MLSDPETKSENPIFLLFDPDNSSDCSKSSKKICWLENFPAIVLKFPWPWRAASVTKIEIRSRHLYYFGSFLWLRYLKIFLYRWSFSEARRLTTIFVLQPRYDKHGWKLQFVSVTICPPFRLRWCHDLADNNMTSLTQNSARNSLNWRKNTLSKLWSVSLEKNAV